MYVDPYVRKQKKRPPQSPLTMRGVSFLDDEQSSVFGHVVWHRVIPVQDASSHLAHLHLLGPVAPTRAQFHLHSQQRLSDAPLVTQCHLPQPGHFTTTVLSIVPTEGLEPPTS